MTLPALTEKRWLRFAVFTAYYMMQGLPIGVIMVALPAWLTSEGVSKELIAQLIGIATLPWAFKLLAAPLIDRFTFLPMGLRRPWIVGTQVLLLITASFLLFITDIETQFTWLIVLCTLMNTFAATEDVAVDGLAIAIIPEEERGRANAFMGAGQISGISLTASAAIYFLNKGGLPFVAMFLIASITVLLVITLLIRERSGERILPWSEGAANPEVNAFEGNVFSRTKDLIKALLLPMSLLMITVAFLSETTGGLLLNWVPQLAIKELEYSNEAFTHWRSTALLISALLGLAFGPLIDKTGALRVFKTLLLINAIFFFGCYFILNQLSNPTVAVSAMLMAQILSTAIFISSIALFMSLCRISISTTQFACYMAVFNLGKSAGSWLYPPMFDFTGLHGILIALSAIFVLTWILVRFFNLDSHKQRLQQLDKA